MGRLRFYPSPPTPLPAGEGRRAIIQAALHGVSTRGSTCCVTHLPCINYTKALINAGIARIAHSISYRNDENAMNFLKAANNEVAQKEFMPE